MKKGILIFSAIVIALAILLGGCSKEEQPVREHYCQTDADCACGTKIGIEYECFYGDKAYVDTERQCPDFRTGIAGHLDIKCVENTCTQLQIREL